MTTATALLDPWLPITRPQQKRIVPEVVQTSNMDCGPAALKAVLEGFGTAVSYGRLREACQTSVDGTSINTIETVAQQLGLDAQQIMLPSDFLFLQDADALPAIVITRLPNGATHFVVVWSVNRGFVQVMNPGVGRRWLRRQALLDELYLHTHLIPADAWRSWAGSSGFIQPLVSRLQAVGVAADQSSQLLTTAQQDDTWFSLATLDAATRLVETLIRSDGIDSGSSAVNLLTTLIATVQETPSEALEHIPPPYWFVQPAPRRPGFLRMRGAVMIVIEGVREQLAAESASDDIPVEIAAALQADDIQPFKEIWKLLREDGLLAPAIIALAAVLGTIGVTVEALLMQGIIQFGDQIIGLPQRINALLTLLFFGLLMILIEFVSANSLARMGRHIDMRLRIAFLSKIPRLSDRYFQSRLISDMTMRAHELAAVRGFPALGTQFLRLLVRLVLTTFGVIYFVPQMFGLVLFLMVLALVPSLVARPLLQESDLRYRNHSAGLSRFYLDGLLGLIPLRTHSAETSFQNAHEMLLTEWFQAGRQTQTLGFVVRSVQSFLSVGSVIVILVSYIQRGGDPSNILLIFYWTLSLPNIGQSIAGLVLQYPQIRNRVLRILEPLGTPDENAAPSPDTPPITPEPAAITLQNAGIVAGGHTILRDLNLTIAAGEHIAIVGPSGAGKSSFVGLLLGWHKTAVGSVLVDGQPLQDDQLEALRRQTVWVDPAVHLWNRTLHDNLAYGNDDDIVMSDALDDANLYDVLKRLPDGLQTELGEGGGLVSGGQGQRVRLGRGLLRQDVRLVILDEPFRGLDRPQRQELLTKVRRHWQQATLIFISHDVGDTQLFDRVLVIEQGQIVEDAAPATLAAREESTYRRLLDAEEAVRRGLWESTAWRRLWLANGILTERE
ncbi:MAG: ATP-binding cassette domain-containing protein [Chloroflexota bacterium]